MNKTTANISEIFSSFQGEGLYVGDLQFFVRFCDCNLNCSFCDTDFSKKDNFIFTGHSGVPQIFDNPISTTDFIDIFENYTDEVISFTGGEPLLHSDFLLEVLPSLKAKGHIIYLETNGTLPSELQKTIKHIDIIAMDYKSSKFTDIAPEKLHEQHKEFYKIACKKEVFVKFIVDSNTTEEEIEKCASMMAELEENYLVIQPMTGSQEISQGLLMSLYMSASELVPTKIIPQCHKLMDIL